ncbi:hypothetical protein [Pseudomonas sp. FEN]|nr:hypothetical protein [Pseudomonas sp. FEN]
MDDSTRRIECNIFNTGHRQNINDAGITASQALVFLNGKQNMRRLATHGGLGETGNTGAGLSGLKQSDVAHDEVPFLGGG